MTNEAREVIRQVRDEFLTGPERWAQGGPGVKLAYDPWDGKPMCLGYAIDFTRKELHEREEAADVLLALAEADIPASRDYYPANIITWNDTLGRTFEEVRALLDRALEEK